MRCQITSLKDTDLVSLLMIKIIMSKAIGIVDLIFLTILLFQLDLFILFIICQFYITKKIMYFVLSIIIKKIIYTLFKDYNF